MKISSLLLVGTLALGVAQPAMAHSYHGHGHYPHPEIQRPQHPSPLETILGVGLVGAGIWWNYGPEIEYEYNGDKYVLCNDFGRRYYC